MNKFIFIEILFSKIINLFALFIDDSLKNFILNGLPE